MASAQQAPSWRPAAPLERLEQRAALYRQIRDFFAQREVLEVETPLLSAATPNDCWLESMAVESPWSGARRMFLRPSPEFAMKRLLAAGSGAIYQLGKAFRRNEHGARHNPEFSLLEWYRPGYDMARLSSEVEELLRMVLGSRPLRRVSYRQLFREHTGLDVLRTSPTELRTRAGNTANFAPQDPRPWRDFLLQRDVLPHLPAEEITFIENFPADQAELARIVHDQDGALLARRFEIFINGMEIANGAEELCNAEALRVRQEQQREDRRRNNLPPYPEDPHLQAALQAGLPECAGIALGLDRLLAVQQGQCDLEGVLPFPIDIS